MSSSCWALSACRNHFIHSRKQGDSSCGDEALVIDLE